MPGPFSVYTRTSKIIQNQERKRNMRRNPVVRVDAAIDSRSSIIDNVVPCQPVQLTPMNNANARLRRFVPSRSTRHSYLLPSVSKENAPQMPSMVTFRGINPSIKRGSTNQESESQTSGIVMSQLTMSECGSHSQSQGVGDGASTTSNVLHSRSSSLLAPPSNTFATSNESAQRYLRNGRSHAYATRLSSNASRSLQMSQHSNSSSNGSYVPLPIAHPRAPMPQTPARATRSWMTTLTSHQQTVMATPVNAIAKNSESSTPKVDNGHCHYLGFRYPSSVKRHSIYAPAANNGSTTSSGASSCSIAKRASDDSSQPLIAGHKPFRDVTNRIHDEMNESGKTTSRTHNHLPNATGQIAELTASAALEHKRHMQEMAEAATRESETAARLLQRRMEEVALAADLAHKRRMNDLAEAATRETEAASREHERHLKEVTEAAVRAQKRLVEEMVEAASRETNLAAREHKRHRDEVAEAAAREIKGMTGHYALLRMDEDNYRLEKFEEEKSKMVEACIPSLRERAQDIIKVALDSESIVNTVRNVMDSFKDIVLDQMCGEIRKFITLPGLNFSGRKRKAVTDKPAVSSPAKKNKKITTKKRAVSDTSPLRRSKRLRSFITTSSKPTVSNHCVTPYGRECDPMDNASQSGQSLTPSPKKLHVTSPSNNIHKRSTPFRSFSLEGSPSHLNTCSSTDDESQLRVPRKLEMDLTTVTSVAVSESSFDSPMKFNDLPVVLSTPSSRPKRAKSSGVVRKPNRIRSAMSSKPYQSVVPGTPNSNPNDTFASDIADKRKNNRMRSIKSKRRVPTYQRSLNCNVHLVEDSFSFMT